MLSHTSTDSSTDSHLLGRVRVSPNCEAIARRGGYTGCGPGCRRCHSNRLFNRPTSLSATRAMVASAPTLRSRSWDAQTTTRESSLAIACPWRSGCQQVLPTAGRLRPLWWISTSRQAAAKRALCVVPTPRPQLTNLIDNLRLSVGARRLLNRLPTAVPTPSFPPQGEKNPG